MFSENNISKTYQSTEFFQQFFSVVYFPSTLILISLTSEKVIMMTYSKQLPIKNDLREMFLFDIMNSVGDVCVCLRIGINLWLKGE